MDALLPDAATRPMARSPGRGILEIRRVNHRSVATRTYAESPLRLLIPRGCPGDAAWVFTSTFGGGLVAGDHVHLDVHVHEGASCLLATQASTKIYRSQRDEPTRQTLRINAAARSTCFILPDPLTCYADAWFDGYIQIDAHESASIVLVDWLTSGRQARGERWAFSQYRSRIMATVASKPVFRDVVRLDQADGPVGGEHRMGRCDCFGLVLLLGPVVSKGRQEILDWTAAQPIARGEPLIFSASPLANGAVLRVAGPGTEAVGRWLRQRLAFIQPILGGDPWSRKW